MKNDLLQKAKTLCLAALVAMTSLQVAAREYFERISMEGVELMGAITWGKVDAFTNMDPGFYLYPFDSKFCPDKTSPVFKADALGGAVYHKGKIYANEFSARSQYVKPMWRIYDAYTHELLSEHELSDNCECTTTALAYDPTTDYIYGFDETYTETYVVRVDPETGEMTRLGDMLDRNWKMFAMACSPDGKIYCTILNKMTDAVYLGKVNKKDGRVAIVRGISATNLLEGDSFINSSYDQSMFYNNATGKLYWMFQSYSLLLYKEITAIYEVNPTDASAVMVAYLEDALQGPGAFFLEPEMKAPAVITDFSWTADAEGAVSGTLSFTLPTTAYDGTALSGTQHLVVVEGNDTIVSTDAEPGAVYTMHGENYTNGWHNLDVYVANAAGNGPTVHRKFFAGYDYPKAATDITLTAEDLHTTLTWTAPTEGQNGYPINTDNLTFTVVRYPGEITVAEGLKECRFEEDHPADMTRYVYAVIPYEGDRKGRSALSNNLIVGTPLNVPYACDFSSPYDMYNYYTIIDANKDGCTWNYDTSSLRAYYQYSQENSADDWLIAPAINYEAGKTYQLTFSAFSSSLSYKESMIVTFGNDKTVNGQTDDLLTIDELPTEEEEDAPAEYNVTFTVPTDSVYYFGFYATSARYREYLYLQNVEVKEIDATAIKTVSAAEGLKVDATDGRLTVTASAQTDITVCDTAGRTVAHAHGISLNLPAAHGTYIVKVGNQTRKVAVK